MLDITIDASGRRAQFRARLRSGELLQLPGAFSPLVAREIEAQGFDGVYLSGAALAADLGLPDIGLTSLGEIAERAYQIQRSTNLFSLVDADTGFGEPMNAARTVFEFEQRGLGGCHLEDQLQPKRCGHLDGKELVSALAMGKRIRAAVDARRDDNFLIMARTDARAVEGLEAAIERARRYVDAGADAIFCEALAGPDEYAAFRKALTVPLLANMTEFGKSPLLDAAQLRELGFNLVIYPVSTLRAAMGAVARLLGDIRASGSQRASVAAMQTRADLYTRLQYEDYNRFDNRLFNFALPVPGESV